jgi:epoxyqueuosine reductase
MSNAMTPSESVTRAEVVKRIALEAGFDLVGIAPAALPAHLDFFPEWLDRGFGADMEYLHEQRERRADVRAAFPWARSLVCVGVQYDTPHPYSTEIGDETGKGWIARYAWGDDYHDVVKALLERLRSRCEEALGGFESRVYVDTGPVVERAYAAAAGLGAWGKNTCLLHPEHGSWFFLGEMVTDIDLSTDTPRADLCGTCTACLDACPTGAFPEPYVLDASRCISYLTIERKGDVPLDLRDGMGRQVFGCDICQDVCPWNRRRRRNGGAVFEPRDGAVAPTLSDLAGLTDEGFRDRFRRSPVKRAKRRGLLRNVAIALGNSGDSAHRPVLEHLSHDEDAVVREHARWALERLG